MSKKIVHLITNDKFTVGYVNFMKMYMTEYEHFFLIPLYTGLGNTIVKDLINTTNTICLSDKGQLVYKREIRNVLQKADQIIISGMFSFEQRICFWPQKVLKKTYVQYWGGDFYQARDKVPLRQFRSWINRKQLEYCFRKTYGAIFLIKGEYEKYKEITGIMKEKVSIAPMPSDPNNLFPYNEYRDSAMTSPIRIIVGNSATKENEHVEAFEYLKRFKTQDIEIFCPLSYGDAEYGEEIKRLGLELFGEKFHPMLEWMDVNEYYRFLSTCHIGIYNTNRQQAMGNINALFLLGKKIYLRPNTSMIESYKERGFKFFDVTDLKNCSFEQFKDFSERKDNIRIADEWNPAEEARSEWKKVFEN